MKVPPILIYFIALIIIITPAIVIYHGSDVGEELDNLQTAKGIPTFITFIIVVIVFTIYSRLTYRKSESKWESGVFNENLPFTKDSLLQAYIRLAGLMLRKDREDLKGKMGYLYRYFDRHFENVNSEVHVALNASFHNPVDLKTITPWLKRNLQSNSQRSQLLYFLVGLSIVDGSLNPAEKRYLEQLADQLGISKKDFDSIMASHSKYEDAYQDQFKQERRRSAPSKSRSQYQREKAAKILGVSVNASTDEIKKAYRSLAKVHHPDRFASEGESQQKIAKERFVKIQLAYELLFEHKN